MRNKIKLSLVLLFLLQYSYAQEIHCGESEENETLRNIAEPGLKRYLEEIPIGQEFRYGFTTREEFKNIVLGEPYRIYRLKNEMDTSSFIDYTKELISKTNEFEIPLLINYEVRCFLHILNYDSNISVIGIGYSKLAKELYNNGKKYINSNSYKKALLYIPSLGSSYLIVDSSKYKNIEEIKNFRYVPFNRSALLIQSEYDYKTKDNFIIREFLPMIRNKQRMLVTNKIQ